MDASVLGWASGAMATSGGMDATCMEASGNPTSKTWFGFDGDMLRWVVHGSMVWFTSIPRWVFMDS